MEAQAISVTAMKKRISRSFVLYSAENASGWARRFIPPLMMLTGQE